MAMSGHLTEAVTPAILGNVATIGGVALKIEVEILHVICPEGFPIRGEIGVIDAVSDGEVTRHVACGITIPTHIANEVNERIATSDGIRVCVNPCHINCGIVGVDIVIAAAGDGGDSRDGEKAHREGEQRDKARIGIE